jgi:hypothetical protein
MVEISTPYKIEEKGDHRFALLATTMLPELDERGDISGVWNRYQLASLFYLTLNPSVSEPVVNSVVYNGGDAPNFTMQIANAGDAHARLQGNAFIKDANGEVVSETPLSTVVLDRHARNYTVKVEQAENIDPSKPYTVDFELTNTFAPQNKFRSTPVAVEPITINTP